MAKKHKPRSGSLAYYPHKRSKKHAPNFGTVKRPKGEEAKPVNFMGYKAGMVHVFGVNQVKGSKKFEQEMVIPATVIECPPLNIFGARGYKKTNSGLKAIGDVFCEKTQKELSKKIPNFKKPKKKTDSEKKTKKNPLFSLNKLENIEEIRLLCHTNPVKTGIGKKKPEVIELFMSGTVEKQAETAKTMLGKELKASEIFEQNKMVDVKAVNKGKGFVGVVKRAGVKIHRPKAKKHRYVGSISPWHPATVMWTVARPGQLGYAARTEYNKQVLLISNETEKINPKQGFTGYGKIKNEYIILAGSTPGPIKRPIGIRQPARPTNPKKYNVAEITIPQGETQ
jgi:large subunit ribosomal protein L3